MPVSLRAAVFALGAAFIGPAVACAWAWTNLDRVAREDVKHRRAEMGVPVSRGSLYQAEELDARTNGAFVLHNATANRPVPAVHLPSRPFTPSDIAELKAAFIRHADLLAEAQVASSHPHFAIPPDSRAYQGSTVIIRRLALAGKVLAARAEVACLDGRTQASLDDLRTLRDVCNRLNRIPTVSSGSTHESLVTEWLRAAATCAPQLPLGSVAELAATLDPPDQTRILHGEASKEMEVVTSVDFVKLTDPKTFPTLWPSRAVALALRPDWATQLALAWQSALAAHHATPSSIDQVSRPLVEFHAAYPNTVEMLTMSDDPSQVDRWLKAVSQNQARRDMLALALQALRTLRDPDPSATTDPFSQRPYSLVRLDRGWKLASVGADRVDDGGEDSVNRPTLDLTLTWEHGQLSFAGA